MAVGMAKLAHLLGSELDAAALAHRALLFLAFLAVVYDVLAVRKVADGQTRVVALVAHYSGVLGRR